MKDISFGCGLHDHKNSGSHVGDLLPESRYRWKLLWKPYGLLMVFYSTYFEILENLLWSLMAISTGIPTFINIFSILILSNKFFELIQDYKNKYFNLVRQEVSHF